MNKEYANKVLAQSKAGYETIAEDFSRTRGKFWDELLFVRDLIPNGAKILDIGCGNGRFLSALTDTTIDYTGVDFSEGLIAVAQGRYRERPNTNFFVSDALTLPFLDHSFDMVVSFAVLHHIPSRAYRVQTLREMARVAKPGAPIVLTAWNVWHSKPRAIILAAIKKLFGLTHLDLGDAFLDFGNKQNVRYVHALTRRKIRSLACEAGLAVKELRIIRRPSGEENFFMVLQR